MRNLLLTLCYDGAGYHGWQIQENALAVQQVLQEAIAKVLGDAPDIKGCSRTDTGVHAPPILCEHENRTPHPLPTAAGGAEPLFARGYGGALL